MFAIIQAKDKQYQVTEGSKIIIEKIDAGDNETVVFDKILLLNKSEKDTVVGQPYVGGASVSCTVLKQIKGDKIVIFKKKRRKNYRKKQGHRQKYTLLRIDKINA